MKIELPPHKNGQTQWTDNLHAITVIGANGAGKSRFGDEIARRREGKHIFRLSALKALFIAPQKEKSIGCSISDIYNELQEKSTYKVGNIDTEFDKLLYLLLYEEFVNILTYKGNSNNKNAKKSPPPSTKLDRVQRMWESIFPQNKMLRIAGELRIMAGDDPKHYATMRLSDGEKAVLYLIASTLFAEKDSIILIEDPEVFLHRSIMKSLWDAIEQMRPDCIFVYLTHNLEFAASRNEGTCIWVKSYDAEKRTWDYETIKNPGELPEEVYLDLLGSRKPILFIGTGEKLDQIEPFHPGRMASRILGMGDVLSLIEKAEQALDQKKAEELQQKLRSNSFTLSDFYDQMVQMRKMGPIQDILGMLPGVNASALQNVQIDEKAMAHVEAIILSMTPYERDNPSCLNYSRKRRISAGCGVKVEEINRLLKQFNAMQQMMKQFAGPGAAKKLQRMGKMGRFGGGGFPGLPF